MQLVAIVENESGRRGVRLGADLVSDKRGLSGVGDIGPSGQIVFRDSAIKGRLASESLGGHRQEYMGTEGSSNATRSWVIP